MTIDELRARKQELLAREKYEVELQEQGKGDNFALFMVNEELLDVNAQLRAIKVEPVIGNRSARVAGGSRLTSTHASMLAIISKSSPLHSRLPSQKKQKRQIKGS